MIIPNFLYRPYLEDGENVLYVCHRHPFVFFSDVLQVLVLGFVVPLVLYYLFPNYLLFFAIWLLISFVRLLTVLAIWYHDAMLITDASLVDVHWKGFFVRTSTRLEYAHVEGVSYEKGCFWAVMFNYGDISVQRPGGASTFCLKDCINPKKAEREIISHQEKYVSDQGLKDAETLKTLLTEMVRKHAADTQEQES